MRLALVASAALHIGIGALWFMGPAGRPADDVPLIEVELIQQAAMERGGSARSEAAGAPEHAAAPDAGEAPLPPPSAPVQTARAAPAVNLGTGPRDLEALSVTGENVVPPAPDAAFRNRPPSYPAAATRAAAEGTVQLLIRVSEAGLPAQVLVAASSGHLELDRAARDAVLLWRFRPARSGGAPVPFDYLMNIRFSLGDR